MGSCLPYIIPLVWTQISYLLPFTKCLLFFLWLSKNTVWWLSVAPLLCPSLSLPQDVLWGAQCEGHVLDPGTTPPQNGTRTRDPQGDILQPRETQRHSCTLLSSLKNLHDKKNPSKFFFAQYLVNRTAGALQKKVYNNISLSLWSICMYRPMEGTWLRHMNGVRNIRALRMWRNWLRPGNCTTTSSARSPNNYHRWV